MDDGGFVTPLSFFYICGLSIARGQDAFSQLERERGRQRRDPKTAERLNHMGLWLAMSRLFLSFGRFVVKF